MKKLLFILPLVNCTVSYCQNNSLPHGTVGYFLTNAVEKESEKKYEQAIIFTDSALLIAPNQKSIFSLRAEILWMMKRFTDAAENYQKAMLLDKDSTYLLGAYLFLGVLYEKAKKPVQAQLQYLKTIYFFEKKKKREIDRFFEKDSKIDYALALKLSGKNEAWDKLFDIPFYKKNLEVYSGKSRDEILEIYFKPVSGDN